MKKIIVAILLVITMFTITTPALAGDIANGAKVFSANCAACHAGGLNVVNGAKTLKKGDLEKYEMYSLEAVKTQITKGKNAMPAFLGRLNEAQIEDVASYVLAQAEKGW
ncbi:cytochrome c6 PetJ [Gloeocapsa sp. PCC 73106]|uniref:cytochrome c6 PetJ n=1 Tax=Gloeocapsa sp. PCC 73106 TaxID=102232 RepID=UPI0002ABC2BC|nr:c-type cytochrome [Gloeocapsa sp. PCC 73106]ELR96578.1 cytochrome c, mono- and diheme variants family [Gloeocapsa sp. PCC 73106]